MQENYQTCFNQIMVYEGGKVNDPKDPGGKTNMGVTQRTFSAWLKSQGLPWRDVYSITKAEASAICKPGYWDKVGGDSLDWGYDLCVADTAFNSGPGRAIPWREQIDRKFITTDARIKGYCAKRLSFLHALRTWSHFGKGWARRVASVEATGLRMFHNRVCAANATVELRKTAATAYRAAEKRKAVVKVGTPVGLASQGAHVDPSWPTWAVVSLGVIIALGVAYAAWKAMHHSERAVALAEA